LSQPRPTSVRLEKCISREYGRAGVTNPIQGGRLRDSSHRTSQLREYIARRQCTTPGNKKRIRSYSPRTYPDRICATPETGCARSRATPEGQNPPAMMRMFAKSIPFDGRNSRCVTTDHSRSWQAETNRTKKIHCFGPSTSSSGTRRFRKI
jgi:hypothetical protein